MQVDRGPESSPEPPAGVLLDPVDELLLAWFDLDPLFDEDQHRNAAMSGPSELLLRRCQTAVEDRLAVASPEHQQVDVGLVDAPQAGLTGGNRLGGVVLEPLALMPDGLDERREVVALLL